MEFSCDLDYMRPEDPSEVNLSVAIDPINMLIYVLRAKKRKLDSTIKLSEANVIDVNLYQYSMTYTLVNLQKLVVLLRVLRKVQDRLFPDPLKFEAVTYFFSDLLI